MYASLKSPIRLTCTTNLVPLKIIREKYKQHLPLFAFKISWFLVITNLMTTFPISSPVSFHSLLPVVDRFSVASQYTDTYHQSRLENLTNLEASEIRTVIYFTPFAWSSVFQKYLFYCVLWIFKRVGLLCKIPKPTWTHVCTDIKVLGWNSCMNNR